MAQIIKDIYFLLFEWLNYLLMKLLKSNLLFLFNPFNPFFGHFKIEIKFNMPTN